VQQQSQNVELSMVTTSIKHLVFSFLKECWLSGQHVFVMRELHDYILNKASIAPGSPDRVLRQLRLNGDCDYKVLNRSMSTYEILGCRVDV